MTDEEVEAIDEDGRDAARNAWGPLGAPRSRACPLPAGSEQAEVWHHAFRNQYAMENRQ